LIISRLWPAGLSRFSGWYDITLDLVGSWAYEVPGIARSGRSAAAALSGDRMGWPPAGIGGPGRPLVVIH
jgi:hypothetical protein